MTPHLSRTPLPSHTWPKDAPPGECLTDGCRAVWDERGRPPFGCKRQPLRRTTELPRTSGLKSVSETNSGREHQRDEAYREWIRGLPCLICDAPPKSQAAHVKNWGAGYSDWHGGGNLYPACADHHREEENELGSGVETFQKRYGVDLASEARTLGDRYKQEGADGN